MFTFQLMELLLLEVQTELTTTTHRLHRYLLPDTTGLLGVKARIFHLDLPKTLSALSGVFAHTHNQQAN